MSQQRPSRSARTSPRDAADRAAELRQQQQLLDSQLAIARATTEHPALERTLHGILDVMASLTRAEGATLFLFDEAGELTGRLVTQNPLPPQPYALVLSLEHDDPRVRLHHAIRTRVQVPRIRVRP